jgi:hypothetical protein
LAVTPREGTGSAVLTVTAQPNAGVTREGALTVGGETVAVSQTAACELVVSPTASRFGSAASEGTITVSTQPGCAWTAASDAGWITLSPRAGDGNSVINYSVAANGGRTFREGTISVAGRLVRISQEGLACDYQLGPVGVGQLFFGQQGGSATIGVLAQSDCEWTVTADPAAPWITIPPPTNHRGNGSFSYTVDALDPNDQDIRTGDITVNAGATSPLRVTITQLRSGPVVEVGAVAGSSSRRR